MKPWVAITAYTPSYARAAQRLIKGCNEHGIPLVCYPYNDRGNWLLNTYVTVDKTLEALKSGMGNILWLDADAIVQAPLPWFDTVDADIAAQSMWNPNTKMWCWNTGTIYWADNDRVRAFVQKEIELLEMYHYSKLEHWPTLHYMIEDTEHDLKVVKLPDEYSVIIRRNGTYNSDVPHPLILHTQLSRQMRRTYGD